MRRKVFPYTLISLVDRRDLGMGKHLSHMNASYSIFSRLAGKPFHMNRTKLFGESKCFLAYRDSFSPYEQALNCVQRYLNALLKRG